MIFTENPEGNSYYLDTVVLKYNQSLPDLFVDATYHGQVIAKTQEGWNYYFTPLGKSWVCRRAVDQGTLRLYNVDQENIGNMTLFNIKVQPFVKRAKGDWGEGNYRNDFPYFLPLQMFSNVFQKNIAYIMKLNT